MSSFIITLSQKKLLLYLLLGLLLTVYLLNFFTPLRLSTDDIVYLFLEDWFEAASPAGAYIAHHHQVPVGYSLTLFMLSKLHLLNTFAIRLVNMFYLFGSLYFIRKIFNLDIIKLSCLLIFLLLNWLTIKLVLCSMAEMQYLFFSSATLYFYNAPNLSSNKAPMAISAFLLIATILTRTVGVSLLIAMAIDQIRKNKGNMLHGEYKNWKTLLLGLLIIIGIVYFGSELKIFSYSKAVVTLIKDNRLMFLASYFPHHLIDLGEMVINIPSLKINFIPTLLRDGLYVLAGTLVAVGFVYLVLRDKTNCTPILQYYLLTYTAIIFCWPYYDARFWFPVLPFVAAFLLQTILPNSLTKFSWTITLAKRFYIISGIFVLGYYTYTSFNKKALAAHQDAGVWRKEYETYFYGKPLQDTSKKVNMEVVRLLKKING